MKKLWKKFSKNQNGATAVEFAFVFPIFLMFTFAMFSFSQMYWIWNTMNYATNEAGRYVMAHTGATQTDIQNKIVANLMGISSTDVTVNVSDTVINGAPFKQIQASYSYKFNFMKAFFGLAPMTLSTQTTVPE